MIDRTHDLPVVRQCQILELARVDRVLRATADLIADLALMRRIDELHLEYPFAGARMLRDLLNNEGHSSRRSQARRHADAEDGHRSAVPQAEI
jgi:putative transposase